MGICGCLNPKPAGCIACNPTILSNQWSALADYHDHKNRQIDENRKISRRIDEIEEKIGKRPHKCPICDGSGKNYDNSIMAMIDCHACTKGIIWG